MRPRAHADPGAEQGAGRRGDFALQIARPGRVAEMSRRVRSPDSLRFGAPAPPPPRPGPQTESEAPTDWSSKTKQRNLQASLWAAGPGRIPH